MQPLRKDAMSETEERLQGIKIYGKKKKEQNNRGRVEMFNF